MQQPKRFQAPTLAEAYAAVRQELGESAVILSTRKAFAPGLFGQPGRQFVEVVARIPKPLADEARRPSLDQDMAAHELVRGIAEAEASGVAPADMFAAAPRFEVPASEGWSHRLDQMQSMLEQLLSDRHTARLDSGPAAVRAMHDQLTRHGFTASRAASLLAEIDAVDVRDEAVVVTAVERRLAAAMPPTVSLGVNRRRTIFLVGPSGAGKTTLAMRIALEMEREHGIHVVVASTDVTRAGAPQQLLAVGAATGLDVRLCYAPEELAEIIDEPGVDLLIVDTAGHSGARPDRMTELSTLLQVARQRTVLLTLPATMKAAAMQEVVSAYSAVGIDGLAVTRCDETAFLGEIADVAIEAAIGIACTTHSEQVSDPATPADNAAFASAVVHARWDVAPVVETAPEPAAPRRRRLAKVG